MSAKLVVLTGSSEAVSVPLPLESGEEFVLGRGGECDLPLGGSAVSRRHCKVVREGDDYKLEDLESHNGTLVNNSPVQRHILSNGDRIGVGDSCVMFVRDGFEPPTLTSVELDDGSLVARSYSHLPPQAETVDFTAGLETLAEFGRAMSTINDAEVLKRRFLEIILELIPARLGVIGSSVDGTNELKSVLAFGPGASAAEAVQISRTVCSQVLTQRTALLSNDLEDSRLGGSASLSAQRVTSLLCVPITVDGFEGLIYLDGIDPAVPFTKNHLHQLTALSFIVAAGLERARSIEDLVGENLRLRASHEIETSMIGGSRLLREVFYLISKAAPNDSNVLIVGESGTGKELVARAIHVNSPRRQRPFVAINCAVLNENLLESELFGHEKGAFTGAATQKRGKFEIADGGTIFLDEIGELAPNLQAKLLRVLQEREFERVGGTRPIRVDVRIVAATNRSLEARIKEDKFRDDLFFRLNVVRIRVPALRERPEDIPLLAQHFLGKVAERCRKKVTGISKRAEVLLARYHWPGNVRELENVIERAVVLGASERILPEDLPAEILETSAGGADIQGDFHERVKGAKREIVNAGLKAANGSYTEAARLLGLHPNNLHRLMRNLGMKKQV
jgi:Nif-specific regulatory protein